MGAGREAGQHQARLSAGDAIECTRHETAFDHRIAHGAHQAIAEQCRQPARHRIEGAGPRHYFTLDPLDSVGVAVVQGDAYGMSPYFRVSYATSMEQLKEGMARIQRACAALK